MSAPLSTGWSRKMEHLWKLVHHYKEKGVIAEPTLSAFWDRARGWNWDFYDALKRSYEVA